MQAHKSDFELCSRVFQTQSKAKVAAVSMPLLQENRGLMTKDAGMMLLRGKGKRMLTGKKDGWPDVGPRKISQGICLVAGVGLEPE